MNASMAVAESEGLSQTEHHELQSLVTKTSLAGVARSYGLSRSAMASLLLGRARRGTVALFRERHRAGMGER